MKFTVDKNVFLKALDRTKAATDSKASTMPILTNVKLVTDPDRLMGSLRVSGTNLFMSSWTDVSCEVDNEGGCCINAKDLYSRLKLMPGDTITVSVADGKATIKAKGSQRKFVLPTLPVEEYPTIPTEISEIEPIVVNDKELAEKLDSTLFSVSTDETRPSINSVLLQYRGNKITLASTDGHRLTVLRDTSIVSPLDIMIPLAAAKEICNLCKESASNKGSSHEVNIYVDGPILFVVVCGFTFSCKTTDGQFPPYQQIIPKSNTHEVRVLREAFVSALKAVSVSTGTSNGVKLTFGPDNKLLIQAESHDGVGADEIEYSGNAEGSVLGVNCTYMQQALTYVCSEYAVIKFSDELDPIVIEQNIDKESTQKEEYLAIVMPCRL